MSLKSPQLRTLIQWFYLPENLQVAKLRADIRDELADDVGASGGGDFHVPFWSDAKQHVVGMQDLHDAVEVRIAANSGKARLYPILRDGFLLWFNERRRWTNAPFQTVESPSGRLAMHEHCTVKINNFLAVSDAGGKKRFVYPYFCESPTLSEEAARLCLWAIQQCFPDVPIQDVRILDVIRGTTFSMDRNPLTGDEEYLFRARLASLESMRVQLRREY